MRITFVITRMGCGGAEKMMSCLVNEMCERGHEATLILLRPDEIFFPISPKATVEFFDTVNPDEAGIATRLRNFARRHARLRKTILSSKPDVAVSFIDVSNVLTLAATKGTGIPVIVSERTNPYIHALPFPYGFLRRKLYPKAKAIVLQTERLRPWAQGWLDAEKIKVIPNPAPSVSAAGTERPDYLQHAMKVIVAMGRLVDCKGFDRLIDAFSMAGEGREDWALLILGDGERMGALKKQAEDLGLTGRVFLPGETGDPASLLRLCDIFVMSSLYEGFPNALCEAMACGLPPISFDCEFGPSEIITDGENGILVPPGDVAALSNALKRLMDDGALRERMGKNAAKITKRFSLRSIMDEWEKLISSVASR